MPELYRRHLYITYERPGESRMVKVPYQSQNANYIPYLT